MKTLVLCRAGLARSHAMVWTLKENYGHDALAAGAKVNASDTLSLLADWADRIVVMERGMERALSPSAGRKAVIADVGPDVWGNPCDPDLRNRTLVLAEAWSKDGFKPRASYSLRPK